MSNRRISDFRINIEPDSGAARAAVQDRVGVLRRLLLSGQDGPTDQPIGLLPGAELIRLVGLSRVRLRQCRFSNAAASLTEAVQLQPDMPEIHNSLGLALAAQGRRDDAIAQFTEALRLRPDLAESRKNLALVRSRGRRGGP